jgi:phosphohistidine phosphatase
VRIFLVRHCRAVEAPAGSADANRWLSAEGRRIARAVGHALQARGVAFDAVLTSPLVRAVQTAEIVAEAADYTGVIEATVALLPGASANVAAGELPARGSAVAVVGHAPDLSTLGAILVQRPSFPPLRPGQVVLVEDGAPVWSLVPDTLVFEGLTVA